MSQTDLLTSLTLVFIMFVLHLECRPMKQQQEGNPYTDINKQNEFLARFEGMSLGLAASPDPGEREAAIRRFQHYAGLPVTGTLDEESIAMMNRDRCGVSDPDVTSHRKRRYSVTSPVRNAEDGIGYYYSHQNISTLYLSESEVWDVLQYAADVWNNVTSNVQISKLSSYGDLKPEDFNIYFGLEDEHYDPMDYWDTCPSWFGSSTLAHAYLPHGSWLSGDIHFNGKYAYDIEDSFFAFSLPWVTVHEMGHSLGLGHSSVNGAVMFPYYPSSPGDVVLHQDDKNGLIALYGVGTTSSSNSATSEPTSSPTSSSTTVTTPTVPSNPSDTSSGRYLTSSSNSLIIILLLYQVMV